MKNKSYEFVRISCNGRVDIIKRSDDLAELVLLKKSYRNNNRYRYEVRPEIVRIDKNVPLRNSGTLM